MCPQNRPSGGQEVGHLAQLSCPVGSGLPRPSLLHTAAEVLLSAAVWVLKLEGRREAEKHRGGTGSCGTFHHGCR